MLVRCVRRDGGGGEVGRVGFDHELLGWEFHCDLKHLSCILEGCDASEGNEATEPDHGTGVLEWTDKAVEHRTHLGGVPAVDGEGVLERGVTLAVAGMDDDVQVGPGGELEVPVEEIALAVAEG